MRRIPPDFLRALRKHVLDGFFIECAYVHQAGYLSWIAEAKRPATRRRKILQSINRLRAQQTELARAAATAESR